MLVGGKIRIIGTPPAPADLGRLLAQRGWADQRDEGVVGVLENDCGLAGAPDLRRLARTTIGDEPDRPVVLVEVARQTTHWAHIRGAGPGRGCQPAVAHTCDRLRRAGEQPAHFYRALVFHSRHDKSLHPPTGLP